MMSARDERIRALGGSRGAKPTGVLMSACAIKHAIGRHASERSERARDFLWCAVCVGGLSAGAFEREPERAGLYDYRTDTHGFGFDLGSGKCNNSLVGRHWVGHNFER